MTDSSCTTIESNYLNRGRVSQSTVDETLLEESSSLETSPQQRCSEERSPIITEELLGTSMSDRKFTRSERTGLSNYLEGTRTVVVYNTVTF
jgi:hypothetical protein